MKLIECPRDAIQGIKTYIPAGRKAGYLNELLKADFFDTIDFGSFVSPKAIPQMADTAEVLNLLDLSSAKAKLLAIVANERGAADACTFGEITYLGYPFSVSETFQRRNTGVGIPESLERVRTIHELCWKHHKELVIYISMAFGNPYGDVWNQEEVLKWVERLTAGGIKIFSLADTVGLATPESISYLFRSLISEKPDLEFGAHFHTHPAAWREKIEAAWASGCRRFDGALLGYGGCPMAKDELVGNMPTESLIQFLKEKETGLQIEDQQVERLKEAFQKLLNL